MSPRRTPLVADAATNGAHDATIVIDAYDDAAAPTRATAPCPTATERAAVVPRHRHGLRAGADPLRRRLRRRTRRDRGPARHQRRRQVDAAQGHLRAGHAQARARSRSTARTSPSLPPTSPTHRGISLMPGGKGVFPTLTVAENLRLAAWLIRDEPERVEAARARGARPVPDPRVTAPGRWPATCPAASSRCSRSAGRSMTQPELLMIDELSLGLAPTIVGPAARGGARDPPPGHDDRDRRAVGQRGPQPGRAGRVHGEGRGALQGPAAELLERPDILRSVFIAGAGADDRRAGQHRPGQRRKQPAATPPSGSDRPATPTSMLECAGVVKRFGGITAVDDVDLAAPQRRDPRPDRPQRRRQDHADGLHLGLPAHRLGPHPPAGPRRHRVGAARAGPRRAWPGPSRTRCSTRRLTVAETIAVARERHLASTRHGGRRVPAAGVLRERAGGAGHGRRAHRADGPRRLPPEAHRRAVHRAAGASSTWPASWPRTPRCSCSTSRPAASPRRRPRPSARSCSGSATRSAARCS